MSTSDRTLEQCQMSHCMIDITARQLDGLRTLCLSSDSITRKEICESEAKLIKLFGRQILAKSKLSPATAAATDDDLELRKYPCLSQWLKVVGISEQCSQLIRNEISEFSPLLDKSEDDLQAFLELTNALVEDKEKMVAAMKCLHLWTEYQLNCENPTSPIGLKLHWTSYTSMPSTPSAIHTPPNCHQTPVMKRPSISTTGTPVRLVAGTSMTLPANTKIQCAPITHCSSSSTISTTLPRNHSPSANQLSASSISLPRTPTSLGNTLNSGFVMSPPSSPRSPASIVSGVGAWLSNVGNRQKASPPPTPKRKNKLYPSISDIFHPLTKSKSHESQLAKSSSETGITKYLNKKPKNLVLSPSTTAPIILPMTTTTTTTTTTTGAPLTPDLKDACSSTTTSDAGFSSASSDNAPSPGLNMAGAPQFPPLSTACNVLTYDGYDIHPNKKNQLLSIPVSPAATSHSMHHSINHSISHLASSADPKSLRVSEKRCRFQTKLVLGTCDLCHKQVFRGKVCRYCKFKYHRDCSEKAAPACGLPSSLVDHFLESLRNDGNNPINNYLRRASGDILHTPGGTIKTHGTMECMSSSSCDSSSASSSPALFANSLTPGIINSGLYNLRQPSPSIQVHPDYDLKFKFPDVKEIYRDISTTPEISVDLTTNSVDSDRSDRTLTGSMSSDRSTSFVDRVDSLEVGDADTQMWSRANSISLALKEWDIPYEELQFGDKLGVGRFGTVYKGQWHGNVAIKVLSIQTDDNSQRDQAALLKAFKLEIAMLRKTRHENLALFMGACMKLPHLAVVTSLCKGNTVYTHTRGSKERLAMNRIIIIASQICQGMGYLHAKGIVHKDLKSRNVFIENGKVIITDFGLSNVLKLCQSTRSVNNNRDILTIPHGWLYYLPPEIMISLKACYRQQQSELPYTNSSDVYAFGTLWYELLSGEWPFKHLHNTPESVIWMVGRGMKPPLVSINSNKDVKEILMKCWCYNSIDRPDFAAILESLGKVPKKRLARSPSHPIHLSRSTESVF